MAEIVLVHGSCFGAWAWEALTPHLRAAGHKVQALDLPGRGGIATSLAAQGAAVARAIHQRAVLIGHSAGGFPITLAAELAPDKVAGLIYLAAYIPQTGASIADLRRQCPDQPMRGSFRLTPDRTAYGFEPQAARAMFFHDCPDGDHMTARLSLEPIAPQETPFGPVTLAQHLPRAAIIATQDRAIPPDWQRAMAKGLGTHDLATGHCPHLASPVALCALIIRILDGWPKDCT